MTAHALRQARDWPASAAGLGVHHLTASGAASWFDYARFVLAHAQARGRALKVGPQQVQAIPSNAYPTAARRPMNSRLDCTRLQATFGLVLPPWQTGVARLLEELLEGENKK